MGKLNDLMGVISNVAVVVGIVVLVIEIDQNNRLLRAESSLSMLQNRLSARFQDVGNPEVAQLMLKGASGEELTALERYRLTARIEGLIIGWEWEYRQYLDGNIEVIPFAAWKENLDSPLYRNVGWESVKPKLSSDFVRFIDEEILNL